MKTTVKKEYEALGKEILNGVRNELLVSMRFLEMAFPIVEPRMNLTTFYIGTDGEMLYYNPRFLAERYRYDRIWVNRSYVHLLLHGLFGHIYKEKGTDGEELNKELWNLSCDITAEYIVDSLDLRAVKKVPSEEKQTLYKQLEENLSIITAETVYSYFQEQKKDDYKRDRLAGLFLIDDHSFWNQKKEDKKDPESRQRKENQWKEASDKMESTMETYFKSMGQGSKNLLKHLKIQNYKKTDYKSFLKRFAVITEEMKTDLDSFDYGFYHYGMELYGNMPLIEELEYKESHNICDFVIALDTSGSCSGDTIRQFLLETFSILKEEKTFGKKVNIHVIQCDEEIKEDIVLTSLDKIEELFGDFKIKGHGGTDFRPVFTYVNELIKEQKLTNLKGLLYFTDGYGIYPKERPPYETAFLLKGEEHMEEQVPGWAIKLII